MCICIKFIRNRYPKDPSSKFYRKADQIAWKNKHSWLSSHPLTACTDCWMLLCSIIRLFWEAGSFSMLCQVQSSQETRQHYSCWVSATPLLFRFSDSLTFLFLINQCKYILQIVLVAESPGFCIYRIHLTSQISHLVEHVSFSINIEKSIIAARNPIFVQIPGKINDE